MKKVVFLGGAVCFLFFTSCTGMKEITANAEEQEQMGNSDDKIKKTLEEANLPAEESERLNTSKFDSLSQVEEQVGYSFQAVEEFTSGGMKFLKFDISQEKQVVNGMQLSKAYSIVTLQYQKGIKKVDVIIFPYDGDSIQSSIRNPICYVSTKNINGIDVHLTEYILRMVSEDYQMTVEDEEFMNSGKGSYSCDFVSEGDIYYRTMYWVEDGIFYEMNVREENVPVAEIEKLVKEFMDDAQQ